MNKVFKSVVYLIACVAIFLFLLKYLSGPTYEQAEGFIEWEKTVAVYFGNQNLGSSEDCSKVFPLSRVIINGETLGPGSLEALLNGVSEEEKAEGYFTSLNDGVLVQRFEIIDKVAYIDFDSKFNERVGGSCRVQNIKSQIETTLNSLPDIDSIVISVNGQTEGILEP